MAMAPRVEVFHPEVEAKAASFFRRMQIGVVVMAILVLAAIGIGTVLLQPKVPNDVLSGQLRELPPQLNTAALSNPSFSSLNDSTVQPIPVASPRPFPFQP